MRCGADDRGRLEHMCVGPGRRLIPAARTRRWRRRARGPSASSRRPGSSPRPRATTRGRTVRRRAAPARIGRSIDRGSVRPVTVITSGSARNTDDQARDPSAIDHRIAVRQGQHVSAALSDRTTRRRAGAGRAAVANGRVLIANQRFDALAVVGGVDDDEIERRVVERDAANRGTAEAVPPVSGCTRPP